MGDAKYPQAVRDLVATYVEDLASRRDGAKVDQWLCVCKKPLTGSFGRKFGHLIGEKRCGLAPCTALSNEQRSELKDLAGGRQKAAPGGAASTIAAVAHNSLWLHVLPKNFQNLCIHCYVQHISCFFGRSLSTWYREELFYKFVKCC